jgi:hypothetical protein
MESAEAVITGKVKALRKDLAEQRRAERAYEEEFGARRAKAERGLTAGPPPYDRSQAQLPADSWFWTPAQEQPPASQPPLDGEEPAYAEDTMPTAEQVSQHDAWVGAIQALEAQLQVLEDLRVTLQQQQPKNRARVVAIRDHDKRPAKQHPWLTVTTSVAYLVLGWLLSMLGSPSAVLHALVR